MILGGLEILITKAVVGLLVGGAATAVIAAFWDEIKEFVSRFLGYILDAIDKTIEVTSDATVFLVKKGYRYYKRVEVYIRNRRSRRTKVKYDEEEISEYDVPDEIKDELNKKSQKKLKLMTQAT